MTTTELMPAADAAVVRRGDALAPDLAALVERVLTDPNVDVTKLERLLDVNERVMDRAAKAAFDDAFSKMWPELPEIAERGSIKNNNGVVQSRYAKYEDIQTNIRPVLAKHGFALRHRTEWPDTKQGIIRVVGILSGHGHSEESAFESPLDKSQYRSDVQSQGSTISYGKRYTTCDLLNIITRGADKDGQQEEKAETPDGYDKWWAALVVVADNGFAELDSTFKSAKPDFKAFTLNKNKEAWAELKRIASKKGASK